MQIPIIDSVISRIHAELSIKDNKIFLKDLNSGNISNLIYSFYLANGTLIDGKQIPSNVSTEVLCGNTIKFGDSKKIIRLQGNK